VDTDEGSRAGYRRNAGDRCYFCKTALYETVAALAEASGGAVLLNGTNADDLGDHRPGLRAAEEAGVRSPLAETGCTKRDVRAIASLWRLSVADKPAQPCLASRIAYGVEVTPERLRRVEEAERYLRRAFGLAVLRVRTEAGERARIEVPTGDIGAVRERFEAVSAELSRLGFAAVAIDPAGFRSGSLNDALPIVETAAVWTGPGQRTTAGTSNTR
ncbi:MAG: ATP-dependent sacrificial sulfur transferase LarE, partial [Planctomycetota bacterium]